MRLLYCHNLYNYIIFTLEPASGIANRMMRERGVEFMVFALCGGDERTARLAGLLLADGHGVKVWALEDAPLPDGVLPCLSAAQCRDGAGCVVLPMPATLKRGFLNAPFSRRMHCLSELFSSLEPDSLVCAGAVTGELAELAEARGVHLRDYGALESYRDVNSLATAEGTIGVLLSETTEVLCGKRAVIIGMGHITSQLAPKLAALGMDVAVASRSPDSRSKAALLGFDALDTSNLAGTISDADIVVNTAPSLVLTASRLVELKPGALVLDLASKPGGTDFDAARAFGIRALTAPGLPGKWSPDTSAMAVRDAIYAILEDEKL